MEFVRDFLGGGTGLGGGGSRVYGLGVLGFRI